MADAPGPPGGPGDPFGLGGLFGPGGPLGGAGGGAPFFAELDKLLRGGADGPVNWELARQTAVRAAQGDDPPVSPAEAAACAEAVRLADLWVDPATTLPAVAAAPQAWTRERWVTATLPFWQRAVDPVAASAGAAASGVVDDRGGQLPPELQGLLGPLMGVFKQVGGLVFGLQVGQALGGLAGEVATGTEAALPLVPDGAPVLVPAGVAAQAAALGRPVDEVRLHLALREVAGARLFASVPWLAEHVVAAVREHAEGVEVDTSGLDRLVAELDPTQMDLSSLDPAELQRRLGDGVVSQSTTPAAQAARERVETLLALVQGWVDVVVADAASGHLPGADDLAERWRRARAEGGAAERTFASLVGLQLRPTRLADAARLWRVVQQVRGTDGRDDVWRDPAELPVAADLDEPDRYARREADVAQAAAGLDDALAELLGRDGDGSDEGGPGDDDPGDRGDAGRTDQEEDPGPR